MVDFDQIKFARSKESKINDTKTQQISLIRQTSQQTEKKEFTIASTSGSRSDRYC